MPGDIVGQSPSIFRIGVANDGTVGIGNLAIVVDVKVFDLTNLRLDGGVSGVGVLWVSSYLSLVVGSIPQRVGKLVTVEAANLVLVESKVAVEAPVPVFCADRRSGERELQTFVGHIA